jgi:hypothetical protein
MTDSHSRWLDLYGDLYDDPSRTARSACLECGLIGHLRLVFAPNQPDSGTCRAYFWCDHCLTGIGPLRAPVPVSGWPLTPKDEATIPTYRLAPDE